MATELILERTHASGPLLPARLAQGLAQIAKVSPVAPRGALHGQELRLAFALSPDDAACPAFMLDIVGQGRRVTSSARGPSAALLVWAFHALAASVDCALLDASTGEAIQVTPDEHRDAALAYLTRHEADVRATRRARADVEPGVEFLAWLAREEHIALAAAGDEAAALGCALPMDDASRAYELLLESDAVEDVFVSERELGWLLGRFRARMAPAC